MGSLVQCLLRNCFENDNDERGDEDDNEHDPHHRPDAFLVSPAPNQMALNREGYIPPNATTPAADTEQRQPLTAAQHNNNDDTSSRRHFRLANFLCQLRQCIQHHTQHHQQQNQNQNQQMSNSPTTTTTTQQQQNNHNITPGSPLRPAHEFTKPPKLNSRTCTSSSSSSNNNNNNNHNHNRNNPSLDAIPAIALDEVVLPGSDLQKQMALYLQQQGYNSLKKKKSKKTTNSHDNNDNDEEEEEEEELEECVICMEGFDETNPRMPTICGCGENKTYFHLPCLYQWIGDGVNGGGDDGEQNRDCPSCRQPLQWEEF